MGDRVVRQSPFKEDPVYATVLNKRYAPYPSYKCSRVRWLGDVPAHWSVMRLKYLATVNDEALAETTDPNFEIVYVDIGSVDSVEGITGREDLVFEDAPSRARRIVRQGDVIVSTVRTYLRAIARIEVADANVIVSTGFAVVRPRDLDDGFCAYALRAPNFVERVVANSVGVSYPAINASDLACLDIACPPLAEQRAIAGFLARETAKIDSLVAKMERLIELLQEKRTALISRAVTKGLDPDVPMKDSGVEWLGEMPAHWEVKRLRATVLGCQNGVWGAEPNGSNDIACVRVADFDRVKFRANTSRPTLRSIEADVIRTRMLYPGDLLLEVSGGGEKQPVGTVVMYDDKQPAVCSNFIAQLRPSEGFESRYLTYLHSTLYSARVNVRSVKQSIGIQNLHKASYLNEAAGFPPLPEQQAIAGFLDRETAKIDGLVSKIHEAIDRLKELRTAFISAAVTGRIDVREEIA